MKFLKFNNKSYPYKLTLSACKELKSKIGKDILQVKFDDVEEIQWIIFLGIKAGCKLSDEKEYLEKSELDDLDLNELMEIVAQITPEADPK